MHLLEEEEEEKIWVADSGLWKGNLHSTTLPEALPVGHNLCSLKERFMEDFERKWIKVVINIINRSSEIKIRFTFRS